MPDMKEALNRKVLGLPAWAWAGIIVGGAWGVYLWNKSRGKGDAPSLADELGVGANPIDTSGHLEDTGIDDNRNAPGTGTGGDRTTGDARPKNNAEWFAAAFDFLTTTWGLDETEVTNSLRDYLHGKTPTGTSWSFVMLVVGKFGPPPEGRLTPPVPSPNPRPVPEPGRPFVPPRKGFPFPPRDPAPPVTPPPGTPPPSYAPPKGNPVPRTGA